MSGQQSRSSKRIQGIAASPPRPLVTRRTTSQSEREETEHTAPRTEPGENLEKTPAETSTRQKCKFTSQAGKRHPPGDQEATGNTDATRPRATQKHDAKACSHKGRDSGFADKSQADCTTQESPTTDQTTRRRPTHEEGDRSSQGSRPSLSWDTADLAEHIRGDPHQQTPTREGEDEVFNDQDLFSPVRNTESLTANDDDEDELYTPVRLWTQRAAGLHPEPTETELSYTFLSSESEEDPDSTEVRDSTEGAVGLLTSFLNTTPSNGSVIHASSTTPQPTRTPTLPPPTEGAPSHPTEGAAPQPTRTPTLPPPTGGAPSQPTRGASPQHPTRTPTQPPAQPHQPHRQPRPPALPTRNMAAGLIKFKAPPVFSGKAGEDAADWMDRYEVLADYNRWTDADKRTNFGIYLEGPARQWFQCLTPPNDWGDTAAVAATQQQAATPAISGMRSIFIREFLQDSYAGYQESRLRKRKQGINEPAAEYYYEIINLCRLMDPNMSEEAKLHHLYEGLKPTLVEKIWVLQPKTCADFLAAVRRHTEAAELACNKGWAVHMLAEEKEKEEEARVAAVGRDQQADRNSEDPTIKQLLEVVQQLQGEIVSMKKQGRRRERSRADSRTTANQSGQPAPPGRTTDGRPICFYCKGEGHIKRYCQKKKNDDEIQNNTTVAMISTSDEENHQEIPLLQIDVGQLLLEEVTIGKNTPTKKAEAVIDTGAAVSIPPCTSGIRRTGQLRAMDARKPPESVRRSRRQEPTGPKKIQETLRQTTQRRTAVEDNEAQPTDPTDGEDTTDNASTDDGAPAEQRLKKASNKKKQTREKKVRFTTAEEETRTSAETEEITQQSETDQSRRYPLRIRKKRFALANTLLYAMVLAVTTNTQPTEAVAQTTTENLASWWPIMLLLTTMKTVPTDGALEVKLSSHGVIFQSLGERFFSDSEWVIVTDISFDQGDKVANELKLWLTEKTKLPIPDSSNYKDGQILPSVKTTDHTSRMQIQKT
ncbi:hypothetical protein DAPPUDRAFT_228655 [Daphnia pulex]|uniref:Uncharacterized protein n=1 Tax=Daphnia pulex TaxID=6669 RepID=E9HFP8_DAPPU|nr:hypothetical protein DAPPUDRAFT_228655 [Daphnia pulex]|eukprot:EFX69465.1 hypothetical protein DAPPUDRAFT_228655 [Daphnia pulex]